MPFAADEIQTGVSLRACKRSGLKPSRKVLKPLPNPSHKGEGLDCCTVSQNNKPTANSALEGE